MICTGRANYLVIRCSSFDKSSEMMFASGAMSMRTQALSSNTVQYRDEPKMWPEVAHGGFNEAHPWKLLSLLYRGNMLKTVFTAVIWRWYEGMELSASHDWVVSPGNISLLCWLHWTNRGPLAQAGMTGHLWHVYLNPSRIDHTGHLHSTYSTVSCQSSELN